LASKRFIEITAKTQEEAQELAKRELKMGETIAGAEVLAAPTRGIFGIVGNPEVRIRYTIEPSAPPQAKIVKATEEVHSAGTPPTMPYKHNNENATDEFHEDRQHSEHQERVSNYRAPARAPAPDYPFKEQVFTIIKEVGLNLGVGDVALSDGIQDDTWVIDVGGANVSQLIGKHGRTLDALQYLLNIMVNKGKEEKTKLVLDVQGYREKRHKGLIMLANRMCRKVIESGKQVELEPMSIHDRRTIHLALKDRNGIETFSKGVEPLRRIVISPKRPGTAGQPSLRSSTTDHVSTPVAVPAKGRSVPMFMEEDPSDED